MLHLNCLLPPFFTLNIGLSGQLRAARLTVVHQSFNLRLSVTERAGRILPNGKRPKFCLKGMVNQKLANQGFPLLQDKFNSLCGLNQSDLPGHNSQDTRLVSARNKTRRRRFRKDASQAGAFLFWKEDTGLAFKLKNAAIDIRLPCKESSVIDQILCRKIV